MKNLKHPFNLLERPILLVGFCLLLWSAEVRAQILVVSSTKSPLMGLTQSEVKSLFLGNPIQGGSVDFRPLERPSTEGSPLKATFLDRVMMMKPGEMKAYWSRKIFTGRGTPPPEAKTTEQVREWLEKEPLMVTYVNKEEFDPKSMKLLLEVK